MKIPEVILIHGVREVAELAYHDYITQELPRHEILGEMVSGSSYYHGDARAFPQPRPHARPDRKRQLFTDLGVPPLNPLEDRVMLCGSQRCWPR